MKNYATYLITIHRSFLTGILLLLLFAGMKCEKDANEPDNLPAITQEGKNTFGCLVDGEVFLPRGGGFNIVFQVEKFNDDFTLTMNDSKGDSKGLVMRFTVNGDSAILNCGEYYYNLCKYKSCPPLTYQISISRYDLTNKILSGEFSFVLPATSSCSQINITQGRFDLKFK